MLNFTVGPVQSEEYIRNIGGSQIPYFRTDEFSSIMLESESLMLELSGAPSGSRAVFITGSGTASMEATVMNALGQSDKALVVNGGSFGRRFAKLLKIHGITYDEIKIKPGHVLTKEVLDEYDNRGYTAFLVNVHETSTGVRYDMDMIADFCRRNNTFLIADAISSFLADEFDMEELGAGIMITGSQKALACAPGISVIVLSPDAVKRVMDNDPGCMYFDLRDVLKNQERGQTPFTPAVGILLQINARLKKIEENGGASSEIKRISELAQYFRKEINGLPFDIASTSLSNAVTPLRPHKASAYDIFTILKNEYEIWVCPNGGDLRDALFRVGHLGNLSRKDYDTLISAFRDMETKGYI